MGIQPLTPHESEHEELIQVCARCFRAGDQEDLAIPHILGGPLYDISYARVIHDDGKIVSALSILPREMWVRGAAMPLGGISCVCTLPEYRQHGYAGMLCDDSIHRMHERGLCTSALMPFSYEYYGKFGWFEGGAALAYEAALSDLPNYAEAADVRASEPGDLLAIAELQAGIVCGRTGYAPRSAQWWEVNREFRFGDIAVYDRDGIEGYIAYRLQPGAKGEDSVTPSRIAVCELVANSQRAARGLCGFLNRCSDRTEIMRWNTDTASLRASTLGSYPHTARRQRMFMYRIVDLVEALRLLFDGKAPIAEPLKIRLLDEIGTWNECPVWITPDGLSTKPVSTANHIEADIRHFSQLHIGYRTASELASLGLLTFSDPRALDLAEALFPRQEPFFPDPDSF